MVCDTPPYGHAPTYQILFKKQLFDLEVNGQGPTKVIKVRDTPSYSHAPTYQISLTYLERQKCYGPDKKIPFKKTIIWPWGQRSRSHEGHYGTGHTALWSCTHISNIIDLFGKTKKLWSGQASLRRSGSGRKNQTKAMSPFVRRGDIIMIYNVYYFMPSQTCKFSYNMRMLIFSTPGFQSINFVC